MKLLSSKRIIGRAVLLRPFVAFCSCILVLFLVLEGWAEEKAAKDVALSKEQLEAVLLLDSSGSMRVTDTQRLRNDGARLFIQFLKRNDSLAIIDFAEKSKLIRPLISYNEAQEAEVARSINAIKDVGEYTDLISALRAAKDLFGKGSSAAEPIIILLSDGKLDPVPSLGTVAEQEKKLMEEVVPELRALNIKVYTLAFSEYADRDLLEKLAVATDGLHWFTPTSEKIHESFADLFLVVKKPQMVPLTSKGFRIDQDIEEATFYINSQDGEEVVLIAPDGERINPTTNRKGLKWFAGQKFDVITIDNPKSGQWKIAGIPRNEGFATLLTNLKLATSWPATVTSGAVTLLEARLYESRKPVVLPEMTDVVKYAFQMTPTDKVSEPVIRAFLRDDGLEGDRIARDGIFSSKVTLEDPGEYKLQVIASGPTFERQQQIAFRVKPRLVSLKVVSAEEALSTKDLINVEKYGDEYFQMQLSPELAGAKKIQVDLYAVDEKQTRYKIPLKRVDNTFEASTQKLPNKSEFTLRASISAEGRRQKKFNGTSQDLVYSKARKASDEDDEGAVVVVEEDKEEVVEEPGFPWIFLVLLLGAVAGVAMPLVKKLKSFKEGTGGEVTKSDFADIAPFEESLLSLQERSEKVEVDFEDPIFTDDSIDLVTEMPFGQSAAEAEAQAETSEAPPPPPDAGEAPAADGDADELLDEIEDGGDESAVEEDVAEEDSEEKE